MELISSILLSAFAVFTTTTIHFEVLNFIENSIGKFLSNRKKLLTVLSLIIATHLVEIIVYALVFYLAAVPLNIGHFNTNRNLGLIDFFYYSAETYSSLGYGDILPRGEIRTIASICPLNGILLLSWSGAFLYDFVSKKR